MIIAKTRAWIKQNIALLTIIATLLQLVAIVLTYSPVDVYAASTTVVANDDLMLLSAQPNDSHRFRRALGAGEASYGGSMGDAVSLIKFDNLSLPANAIITGGTLRVRMKTKVYDNLYGVVVSGSRITSAWNGSSTWNSFGNGLVNHGTPQYQNPSINVATNYNLDVSDAVKAWNNSPNYGLAIDSTSNGQGGWFCSVRNYATGTDPSTGRSYTGGQWSDCTPPQLSIQYIINEQPNQPAIDSGVLNNGDTFGGKDEIASGDCTISDGCNVDIKITNFGDPNTQPEGAYSHSKIYFEPQDPGTGTIIGQLQEIDHLIVLDFDQSVFVKDGYYKIYVTSWDAQGLSTTSNPVYIIVDTTAPTVPVLDDLGSFTAGLEHLLISSESIDVISGDIKYDFCRTNAMDPSVVLADIIDADFVHCSDWVDDNQFGFGSLETEQKYFYRARSRDTIDVSDNTKYNYSDWSSIQSGIVDNTPPEVSNVLLTTNDESTDQTGLSFRISAEQIDGIFDSATLTFGTTEKFLDTVQYELVDISDGLTKLTKQLTGTATDDTNYTFSAVLDGLADDGVNYLADGVYTIKITAKDLATNTDIDDTATIVLDNTPGNINISIPANNAYTNQPTVDISGQLTSDDTATLTFQNLSNGGLVQPATLTEMLDGSGNQTGSYLIDQSVDLDNGINQFQFVSTDSVSNTDTKVITINRESEQPAAVGYIDSSLLTQNHTDNVLNNRKPSFTFNLSDPNTQSNGVSGIDNSSIDLSLFTSTGDEIVLLNNGIDMSTLGNLSTDCDDNVVPSGDFVTGPNTCLVTYVFANDLQPDDTYTLQLGISDKAGNASQLITEFGVDTYTYLVVDEPVNNSVFARDEIVFSGRGEQGAELVIQNDLLNSEVSIVLNEANSGAFGYDINDDVITVPNDFIQSTFTIVCDGTANTDFDNSANTDNPVCTWVVTLAQSSDNTTAGVVTNTNTITILDNAGNTETENIITQIDLFAIDIVIDQSTQFISADGNGKQDTITFTTDISNPSNPDDEVLVDNWTLTFRNEDNVVVRTVSGSNSLPSSILFDGKQDDASWLEDGNYTWELDLDTVSNPNLPLISGSFQNVTNNTTGVFITSPGSTTVSSPFVSSNGVVNIYGQASLLTETAQGSIRHEDIQVKLCVDTIGLPGTCDYEKILDIDDTGYFSIVAALYSINPTTDHIVQARIIDKFGNEGQLSNKVYIRVSPSDPFKSVKIIPTYTGINNALDIAVLSSLEDQYSQETDPVQKAQIKAEIDNYLQTLKQIILRSEVSQDTQYVSLAYSDLSNVMELTGAELARDIGWINNQPYSYTSNVLGATPTDGSNRCDQSSGCMWDFAYPVPNLGGGLYKIDFTGKKGTTIQTVSVPFMVNADLLAEPTIFDINKVMGVDDTQNLRVFDNTYYTNTNTIEIKGATDAGSAVVIRDTITNQILCNIPASDTILGLFSCSPTLPTSTDYQQFSLSLVATKGVQTVVSSQDTQLVYDSSAPTILDYENLNNNHSQIINTIFDNPDKDYKQSGNAIEVTITTDEPTAYIYIANRDEKFRYSLDSTSADGLSRTGQVMLEGYAPEGSYTVEYTAIDYAGNQSAGTATYTLDNTNPDIAEQDTTNWGQLQGFDRDIFDQTTDPLLLPNYLPSNHQPAKDRLITIDNTDSYVTKDDSIELTGYNTVDTYIVIKANNVDISATIVDNTECLDDGITCYWSLNLNLPNARDTINQEAETNSSITRVEPDNKGNTSYNIQLFSEDRSGNQSALTNHYIVTHDTTAPGYFEINNISDEDNKRIVDFQFNAVPVNHNDSRGNLPAITNDTTITIDAITEQYADVEYLLMSPQGGLLPIDQTQNQIHNTAVGNSIDFLYNQNKSLSVIVSEDDDDMTTSQYSLTFTNSSAQNHTVTLNLGTIKVGNGDGYNPNISNQTALQQEGVYTICKRSADSANNQYPLDCFNLERDTTSPTQPRYSGGMSGLYQIVGTLQGEAYTTSPTFGMLPNNNPQTKVLKYLDINNDNDWERTFTFCSNLTDRAGNKSKSSCFSVTTPIRPPRDGECQWTDEMQQSYNDNINSEDIELGDLIDQIGYSKSCKTYAADEIMEGIKNANDNRREALQCIRDRSVDRYRDETEFVGPVPVAPSCDDLTQYLSSGDLDMEEDYYTGSLDEYRNQQEKRSCVQDIMDDAQDSRGSYSRTEETERLRDDCFGGDMSDELYNQYYGYFDDIREQNRRGDVGNCTGITKIPIIGWIADSECADEWVLERSFFYRDSFSNLIGDNTGLSGDGLYGDILGIEQGIDNYFTELGNSFNDLFTRVSIMQSAISDFLIGSLLQKNSWLDIVSAPFDIISSYNQDVLDYEEAYGDLGDIRDDLFNVGTFAGAITIAILTGGAGLGLSAALGISGLATTGLTALISIIGEGVSGYLVQKYSTQTGIGQIDYLASMCANPAIPYDADERSKICNSGELDIEAYRDIHGADDLSVQQYYCGVDDFNLDCAGMIAFFVAIEFIPFDDFIRFKALKNADNFTRVVKHLDDIQMSKLYKNIKAKNLELGIDTPASIVNKTDFQAMTDFVKYMDDTGTVFKIDITDPSPTIITFSPEEVITKINNNQPLVQKYVDTNFGNGSFANSFDYVTDAQELFYKLQRSRTAISQADELSATLGADIYNNRYTNLIEQGSLDWDSFVKKIELDNNTLSKLTNAVDIDGNRLLSNSDIQYLFDNVPDSAQLARYAALTEEVLVHSVHILQSNGNPARTLRVTTRDGKVVWLEGGWLKGDVRPDGGVSMSNSGWKHINEEIRDSGFTRTEELVRAGLASDSESVMDLIFDIIETGTQTPASPSGTIYRKSVNGKNPYVLVSKNGYIVTISPN